MTKLWQNSLWVVGKGSQPRKGHESLTPTLLSVQAGCLVVILRDENVQGKMDPLQKFPSGKV